MRINKNGVSMNGRIENTRNAKPIDCNCKICGWSKTLNGKVYCTSYCQYEPNKTKCKRYYTVKDLIDPGVKGIRDHQKLNEISSWEPQFPWERRI